MSTAEVDKYSSGTYTTAQGQQVPQYNVASGIGLDAWRQARNPQAPLQPPPPQPPPFQYRTYGGGVHPSAPNGQFPPQFNVGSQAGVDLYQSTYPSLEKRIDLNPHGDWIGGMSGLYFSSGYPFPNPPAGYNIQEATALEIASMGGFQGLEALGGNVQTNDQFLASMTAQYGQAFGGSQTDIPEVKIDPQQIGKWGWLVGMVLGGVPYAQLVIENKDNTDPNDPLQETTNKENLPVWASQGSQLSPHKLYSIVMDSGGENTNAYLGYIGKPPIEIRPQYELPQDYHNANMKTTLLGENKFLGGLGQKDIAEIRKASATLNKKSSAQGGGLTSADQDLLSNLQQLINNDNVQKQQIPQSQRALISASNSQFSTGVKGQLARATANQSWITNFQAILLDNIYQDRETNNTSWIWYKNYTELLVNKIREAQHELAKIEDTTPLKENFGSQQTTSPLGYVFNKKVYEEVINANPKQTKEFGLDKIEGWKIADKGVLLYNFLEQNTNTRNQLRSSISELSTLSTHQQVANKSNIQLALSDMKRRGIKLTPAQVSAFMYPPIPKELGEVGSDIQQSITTAYPSVPFYIYWVINEASKYITIKKTADKELGITQSQARAVREAKAKSTAEDVAEDLFL
jgi:hypothetical protein